MEPDRFAALAWGTCEGNVQTRPQSGAASAGHGTTFEGKASKVHAASSPLADRVDYGARGGSLRGRRGSLTVTASYAEQTYRDSAGSDVALAVMAERSRLRKHRQPERRFDSMVMVIQGMSGR